jgi:predicted DNA-binding transcriptional regulator AlpA
MVTELERAATRVHRRFFDVHDLVDIFGIHQKSFRRMVLAGKFPAPTKIGKRHFWPKHMIEDYITQRNSEAEKRTELLNGLSKK